MSGIDNTHVQDMAKLIAAMNAVEDSPPKASLIENNRSIPVSPPITPNAAAMGKILAAFSAATNEVVGNTTNYPELQRALVTEATETGARIGSWEICGRTVDGMGKFYDVNHAVTRDPIVRDLRLYEAAHALVDALNEGDGINSMRIKTILNAEEEYSRALTDAVQFATRMKVTEGAQHSVAEARYSSAKQRAMTAKKSLSNLAKLF